ncbi:MAG TPA: thioredoxin domain-containing protein [Pyrinomonadaceae bacterium]|nr:thioredoxin domain-containing protein [Pyrinomonadaceae bacterium]
MRIGIRTAIFLAIASIGLSVPGFGQNPAPKTNATSDEDIRKEIRELKQGQDAIQKELQEIKRLLLAKQAADARPPRPERISIDSRPFKGSATARLVLVEFSDYQCPFCGRFYRDTLPQVDKEYIQSGKLKYVFNNLPLDDLHPVAFKAAQAVECAGDQGKFWDLHARLFSNQNLLAGGDLSTPAKAVGLNMPQFEQCLSSGKTESTVRASVQQAESLGIQSTPSFVIGLVDGKNPGDGSVRILGVINGAYPFPVFKTAIDKALATQ